ncbi:MAG: hypothetical protein U1A78_33505 [Polyangia bacterium]
MDLYTRNRGPAYVPAFAGRLVGAMGKGIARTSGETQAALAGEDVERLWTLALVVVQWYADALPAAEAQAVREALQPFELAPLAMNLNGFREALVPFVRAAHEARSEAQLAAAGVYFAAAIEQIGVGLLSAALHAAPLQAMQAQLVARFPVPAEVKTAYAAALGRKPQEKAAPAPAAVPGASRGERFDRSDLLSARKAKAASSAAEARRIPQREGRAVPTPQPLEPPRPRLEGEDVTRAYLHTLGWDADAVERLLAGPIDSRRA